MMPFSVLRMWGLGIVAWSLTALGVFLLYQVLQARMPAGPAAHRPVAEKDSSVAPPTATDERRIDMVTARSAPHAPPWWYLPAGIGLLGLSFGGWLPVGLVALFFPARQDRISVESLTVKRPDGTRLHVEVSGPAAGPTLVLTHGWSLDISAWRYMREELSKEVRVVSWDLPGLGKSACLGRWDFSMEAMARDLEAVLHKTAPDGEVFLLGHSVGGMLTQTYCRLFPTQLGDPVRGIILLHCTYTDPCRTALGAPLLRAIETPILKPLNYLTAWLAPLTWLSNWQSYLNGSLHLMTRLTSFSGRESFAQLNHGALLAANAWPGVVARGNLAMTQFDEQETLRGLEIPALILAGKHDRLTKPAASDHLAQLLPDNVRDNLNGGHLGFWEASGDCVRQVLRFVEDHAARVRSSRRGAPQLTIRSTHTA